MILRLLAFSALLVLPRLAMAAGLTIGVVAPQSGPYALLGKQILTGARLQIEASGNTMLSIEETCEEGSGDKIATKAISGGASVLIGFLCSQSLREALTALKQSELPAITLSARSPILFEDAKKDEWPLFSLAPRPSLEEAAITKTILKRWTDAPVAILDDGTIQARELAENIRQNLEEAGLAPALVDTYRPALENQVRLIRRLKKAGVKNLFISGDRKDIAVFARDSAAENTGLKIMGGETLLAADDGLTLPDGVLAVMPKPWRDLPQASAIVSALTEKNIVVEGYMLPAHAAAKVAIDASEKSETEGKKIADVLMNTTFQTAIGSVKFDSDGIMEGDRFQLFQWKDGSFQAVSPGNSQTN